MVEAFVAATTSGDLERLLELLAPDVNLVSDGGGLVSAARHPVRGERSVARFLLGLAAQAGEGHELLPSQVNGGPGLLVLHHGEVDTVFSMAVVGGRVTQIHAIRSPEKLKGIRLPR